jgi:hypothetical protein
VAEKTRIVGHVVPHCDYSLVITNVGILMFHVGRMQLQSLIVNVVTKEGSTSNIINHGSGWKIGW